MNDTLTLIVNIFTIIGAVATVLIPIFVIIFNHIYSNMQEKKSRDEYTKILKKNKSKFYSTGFEANYLAYLWLGLDRLDEWFGVKLFSFKALSLNIFLSYIYPVIFFFSIWLFTAKGNIGEIIFLNENLNFLSRFEFLIVFLFISTYIYKYATQKKFFIIISLFFLSMTLTIFFNLELLLSTTIFIFLIFFIIKIIKKIETKIITIVNEYKIMNTSSLIIVIFLSFSYIMLNSSNKDNSLSITLIIFFFIIPFINGIFDFISLAISRSLSRKILIDDNWIKILFHILLDFLIAIFLFISLGLFLIFSIDLFNNFIIDSFEYRINIQYLINSFIMNPLGKDSLWITLILFTTLIPTLIHLILASMAIFIFFTGNSIRRNIIEKLEYNNPSKRFLTLPALYFTIGWFLVTLFVISIILFSINYIFMR